MIRDSLFTGIVLAALVAASSLLASSRTPPERIALTSYSPVTELAPEDSPLQDEFGLQPAQLPRTLQSGIEGQVLNSVCPIIQAGLTCPQRSYPGAIAIFNSIGQVISRVQLDQEGRFRVQLQPGTYILKPEGAERIASTTEQTLIVTGGQFTPVRITYGRDDR